MKNCQKPTCVYSKLKKKCVKPNPYIQFISHCSKLGKISEECKKEYKVKNNEITQNACYYYLENNKIGNISSCPKNRRPINNNCSENFPILKSNKYNIKCCYKDISIKSKIPSISSSSSNSKTPLIKKQKDTKIPSISSSRSSSSSKFSNISSKDTNSSSTIRDLSIPKNPFENLNKNESYLNKKLKKYYKPVYKYKNLKKPIKI